MTEEELNPVWQHLLNGEIDILVCTTLIETGIDVRNCNTLIIEDADRMGLAAGERVISMRRLRLADDVPMLIEHTYLPGKIFSGLTSDEVDSRSLYKIMAQDYHVEVRVAEEEFYASVARREDARLLGISEGAPVLQLFRLTYNTRNQVVEFTKGVARADQFHYKVSYYGGSSA